MNFKTYLQVLIVEQSLMLVLVAKNTWLRIIHASEDKVCW